jgi:ABC-type maltose transport system permease subunit
MIESVSVPEELAASMVLAIPLFVLFVVFQKKLLGKVSLGGLK